MRVGQARVLVVLAAGMAALTRLDTALANGDHGHSAGIPAPVLYALGGFAGLVMLIFVFTWARSQEGNGSDGPPEWDDEVDWGEETEGRYEEEDDVA